MFFRTGHEEIILFQFWKTEDVWSFALACGFTFISALCFFGLKYYRGQEDCTLHVIVTRKKEVTRKETGGTGTDPNMSSNAASVTEFSILGHFLCSVLYSVETFVFYCLMLLFMMGNIWLELALLSGTTLGYFFFDSRVVVDITETKQAVQELQLDDKSKVRNRSK